MAVLHLLADVQVRLGNWEEARRLYLEVLEQEEDNVAALVDLGVYHAQIEDPGTAQRYFERAVEVDSGSVVAYYNLSQVLARSFLFEEEKDEALQRAQALDFDRVQRWMADPARFAFVRLEGGVERVEEIRAELAAGLERPTPVQLLEYGLGSIAFALGTLALCVFLQVVLARHLPAVQQSPPTWPWVQVTLPGYLSADLGRGFLCLAAWIPPAVCIALPWVQASAYASPLGLDAAAPAAWLVSILGLLLIYGARYAVARWELLP